MPSEPAATKLLGVLDWLLFLRKLRKVKFKVWKLHVYLKDTLASYLSLFTPSILHIITPRRTGAVTCEDKKIASFVISSGLAILNAR